MVNASDHIHGVNIFYSKRSTSSSPSFISMYVLFDNMPISSVNQTTPHAQLLMQQTDEVQSFMVTAVNVSDGIRQSGRPVFSQV